MITFIKIDFYKIKKIKDYFFHNNHHSFTLIMNDNSQSFITLKHEDFLVFWSLYHKLK